MISGGIYATFPETIMAVDWSHHVFGSFFITVLSEYEGKEETYLM